jgi:hypothetical protein
MTVSDPLNMSMAARERTYVGLSEEGFSQVYGGGMSNISRQIFDDSS